MGISIPSVERMLLVGSNIIKSSRFIQSYIGVIIVSILNLTASSDPHSTISDQNFNQFCEGEEEEGWNQEASWS